MNDNYDIRLTREASGFDYQVFLAGQFVCYGWSAGTRAEVIADARWHAAETIKAMEQHQCSS